MIAWSGFNIYSQIGCGPDLTVEGIQTEESMVAINKWQIDVQGVQQSDSK